MSDERPVPDEVRLLARDSSRGYVDYSSGALAGEPEALAPGDLHAVVAAAHEKAAEVRRHGLRLELERAMRSAKHYEALQRHAERQIRRLRAQLSEARPSMRRAVED